MVGDRDPFQVGDFPQPYVMCIASSLAVWIEDTHEETSATMKLAGKLHLQRANLVCQ